MATQRIAVTGATGRVGHHVVDVLQEWGATVVPISRAHGVDLVTGEGLAAALTGVDAVVDAATPPTPEGAAEFFATATRNLQEVGARAGVQRLIVVSIIGTDRFVGGGLGDYYVAKVEHEQLALAGPIPVRILRAAQFHEFVPKLVEWGTQGDVAYVPNLRTQVVAARSVAKALADLAVDPGSAPAPPGTPTLEIAGPREENLVDLAVLLTTRRGLPLRIEAVSDPSDPNSEVFESGGLLPGPYATLAGPTFEEWLEAELAVARS
jgi:uncharacterized protein YbjT (DUF2867 family)